mmetsp:Transcript_3096/g.8990  ORF Transcript_3096/g.8990 Transcript_3096/m.8990 type:complete len:257 (-) Transcript_3096:601-1371(-)
MAHLVLAADSCLAAHSAASQECFGPACPCPLPSAAPSPAWPWLHAAAAAVVAGAAVAVAGAAASVATLSAAGWQRTPVPAEPRLLCPLSGAALHQAAMVDQQSRAAEEAQNLVEVAQGLQTLANRAEARASLGQRHATSSVRPWLVEAAVVTATFFAVEPPRGHPPPAVPESVILRVQIFPTTSPDASCPCPRAMADPKVLRALVAQHLAMCCAPAELQLELPRQGRTQGGEVPLACRPRVLWRCDVPGTPRPSSR